jgi:DNA-binding NarL/FixJ family response regulator
VISPIRILVREVPPLVRDVLLHALDSASDMELMPEPDPPLRGADAVAPDVVIMTAADAARAIDVERLLWQWPRTRVLVIRLEGHESVLYEMRLHGARLGDRAPSELVDAIRAAVRQRES